MKRSAIRVLIGVASVLLLVLVYVQVTWVQKAYQIEEKQFNYDVTSALLNVVGIIAENASDSTPIYDPIEQVGPYVYTVNIIDTLHPFYLESLLKTEFQKLEINEPFQYSVHDCFTDSIVYTREVHTQERSSADIDHPVIHWGKDNHHFSVFFPNRAASVAGRLNFWIYSSIYLIVVVAFFYYVISVILKQRKLSEVKTDFINNMTHEFKTPISTIGLSSEVLLKDSIVNQPDRLKNYAKIINQENKRLQLQVERILQIATIEKEQINLRTNQLDIHQIIEKVSDTFKLNVEAKSGDISLNLVAEDCTVKGDEVHLTNILNNLVDNAIKYSDEAPHINISTSNQGSNLIINIKDNGIGIDPNEQKQIFDKFYRVPKGNVHDVKGFGIGLNYVKVMIEQHGGKISVTSNDTEKGSTFTIRLPLL